MMLYDDCRAKRRAKIFLSKSNSHFMLCGHLSSGGA